MAALAPQAPAYPHVISDPAGPLVRDLRGRFGGPLVASRIRDRSADAAAARHLVASGEADLVAVGRAFLANPDPVHRRRTGARLDAPGPATFYGGDRRGSTDYPALSR